VRRSLPSSGLLSIGVPAAFVVLWATGFVSARLVAPYVEPMTFLVWRFGTTTAILLAFVLAVGAPWPKRARDWGDAVVAGLLLQGVYLGCVFWAIAHGIPAGVAALIAAAQPLLTALLAGTLLGERVSPLRWGGIATGFLGVGLVLWPKLGGPEAYPGPALAASIGALLAMTAGTIWQKRTGAAIDLRMAALIHFGASFLLVLGLACAFETGRIEFTPAFWVGYVWSVLGNSIGAVGLLLFMISRGAVVGVTSVLFLVPPIALLMSNALFGDTMGPVQIAGMAVAVLGVALAARP
jgi:drug/metabolite transporter (DMT)-like permease